ncbi:unnamed protein product [Phytomonas sp. EM1]|nr:unnamed protein product [Phytomonas sp. EM1]|eukprot:CCW63783.1 unnamed protein product [Phytomonas sp. isolate EM1]
MFKRTLKTLVSTSGLVLQATTLSRVGDLRGNSDDQVLSLQENEMNRVCDGLCAAFIEELWNCKGGALRSYFEQRLLARGFPSLCGSFPSMSSSMPLKDLDESRAALLRELWGLVSPHYYRAPGDSARTALSGTEDDLIVPFDWTTTLREVAAELPFEGVTETDFVSHLQRRSPALPASNLSVWLCKHFHDLLLITRSAVNGEPLYYNRCRNSLFILEDCADFSTGIKNVRSDAKEGASDTAFALKNALDLLNRGKQLPIWTDFADVAALLPANVCPFQDNWSNLLDKPGVRDLFEVEPEFVVWWSTESLHLSPMLTIVDTSSLSTQEQESLLQSILHIRIDGVDSLEYEKTLSRVAYCEIKAVKSCHDDPSLIAASQIYAEEVIMDDLLDPAHFICALISMAKEESPGCIIHVMCGDTRLPAIESLLKGIPCSTGVTVYLHTPLQHYCMILNNTVEFDTRFHEVGKDEGK